MKSTVLIKYSGKYIEIYFSLKITFLLILHIYLSFRGKKELSMLLLEIMSMSYTLEISSNI